jgi:deazaflavin-dependent oxidoreductase (nitroreductase family)
MKVILKSPLHGTMSGSTMLLTFTGRKSGQQYTTPISYARDGDTITLITNRKHGWWRNFQTESPVTARVKGEDLPGKARIVAANEAALVAVIEKVYRGIPHRNAEELAPEAMMIKVSLN